jgi:hypothetical protein
MKSNSVTSPAGRTALEDAALVAYKARNESYDQCVVYHLTKNGLFAEFHDLVMTMLWAWQSKLQFVLDSSRFLYGPNLGWSEFFKPFCNSLEDIDASRVVKAFEFNPKGRPSCNTQVLRSHRPHRVCIGDLTLEGYDSALDFFKRMIFQLNDRCSSKVSRHIQSIELPNEYFALQIRRGDKIGEDDYYPVGLYFSKLGKINHRDTIFVMSDDYSSVEEVQKWLDTHGLNTRVVTLCEPQERGFNINFMRQGKLFTKGLQPHNESMQNDSLEEHTFRLLAEILLASGALRLVTTRISFLGMALRAMNRDPNNVVMLLPEDVFHYVPPALEEDRHILDSYQKVMLIRPGFENGRFFTCVLSALNQIAFCERQNFLPVIDFNASNCKRFHDTSLGDDIWAYYFKPVAGYTKADIIALIRNDQDRLKARDVVYLDDERITRLCHFDTRSIFHYPLGHWRKNPPSRQYPWIVRNRQRGHLLTSRYIAIKQSILAEVEDYVESHMKGHRVLGIHIRGTDLSYSPPVPISAYLDEINRRVDKFGYDRLFLATDQAQYVETLKQRYGGQLIFQSCRRSSDGRNPSDLDRSSAAAWGTEALIDALLLAHCKFVVHGTSALVEFSHYVSSRFGSHNLCGSRRKFAGWDYSRPESDYVGYPTAWELVGEKPKWGSPVIGTTKPLPSVSGKWNNKLQ